MTVEIRDVLSQPITVVRGRTTAANLPKSIRGLFDEFYAGFRGKAGLNIVFYPTWDATGEFEIECGVQLESGGSSSTPAGKIATTVYFGPYGQLKSAHEKIHRYVRENGYKLARPSWEVYGHWSADPAKLQTDIFYLLAREP